MKAWFAMSQREITAGGWGQERDSGQGGGSLSSFSPGEHREDSEKWKRDGLIHYGIQHHLMPGLVLDDHEHPKSHHSNWQRNIPAACRTPGGQQVAELRPQIPGVEGSSAEGRIPESGGHGSQPPPTVDLNLSKWKRGSCHPTGEGDTLVPWTQRLQPGQEGPQPSLGAEEACGMD